MRQETKKVITAFIERRACRMKNSNTDGQAVYLFDNKIAWYEDDGSVSMWLCGHGTPTTRDRLNALCEMLIGKRPWHQKKNVQYYDDYQIGKNQIVTIHTLTVMDEVEARVLLNKALLSGEYKYEGVA